MSPSYGRDWARKAEADATAARRALRDSRRSRGQADIACFHAQQCAEKYLKAVLARHDLPIPRIHDLVALASLAGPSGLSLRGLPSALRSLSRYAVLVRYPGLSATHRAASQAVKAMESVAAACRMLLASRRRLD